MTPSLDSHTRRRPRFSMYRGRSSRRWLDGVLVFLVVTSLGAKAFGAPDDRAIAEALFDRARALIRDGKAGEACPLLEESQRIDPGIGTLLHLGECYERLGRTASAWAVFRDAASAARAAGQVERERLAQSRAVALEGKVGRFTVVAVPAVRVPGLAVVHDGTEMSSTTWGTELVADPGRHVFEAHAPGYRPFSIAVTLGAGDSVRVEIPHLVANAVAPATSATSRAASESTIPSVETASSPARTTSDSPPLRSSMSARRKITVGSLAAVGALGFGLGGYFGLRSFSRWSDSRSECDASNTCSAKGLSAIDDARGAATLSTVLTGVGAASLGVGAYLWWTTPTSSRTVRLHPGQRTISMSVSF